jgi:hypothetical protein
MSRAPLILLYTAGTIMETLNISVPTTAPFRVVVPDEDVFQSDVRVTFSGGSGEILTKVSQNPEQGQYTIADGVYLFSPADAGQAVTVSYDVAKAIRVDALEPPFTLPPTKVTLSVDVTQLCPPGWPTPPDQTGAMPVKWYPGLVIPAFTTIGAYRCVANALIAAGVATQA